MKDIQTREDIDFLVNQFYSKAMGDSVIGHFFDGTTLPFHLKTHIPVVASFWESILLGTGNYKGNPMTKHIELSALIPMQKEHFNQWLSLWTSAVDENFSGKKATEAKERAQSIAAIMLYKVEAHTK
jgi:hemoglobin